MPAPTELPPDDTFAEPPAAPPADDLFGEPPTTPDLPLDDPAPLLPPDEPAAQPAPGAEDMPADPAAPDAGIDDLFNEAPATPDPAEPAPGAEPSSDSVDDLFKETSDPLPPAAEPAAAPDTDPAAAPTDDVDDLFSEPSSDDKSAATSPRNAVRRWTDNTGKYSVNARLVMVSQTHVRLLKENGRYTTVPLTRLSQPDLAFVRLNSTDSIASW